MDIKTIIRLQNNMVMVFDGSGEQVPECQGKYEDVKAEILKKAPPDAVFHHWFDRMPESGAVSRESW